MKRKLLSLDCQCMTPYTASVKKNNVKAIFLTSRHWYVTIFDDEKNKWMSIWANHSPMRGSAAQVVAVNVTLRHHPEDAEFSPIMGNVFVVPQSILPWTSISLQISNETHIYDPPKKKWTFLSTIVENTWPPPAMLSVFTRDRPGQKIDYCCHIWAEDPFPGGLGW